MGAIYTHRGSRGARSVARPDLCLTSLAGKLEIHPSHLGRILRGIGKPSLTVLQKLARELGQSVDDLLNDIREQKQKHAA